MPERIVILDAHTSNPGDLSWDAIAAFGGCEIYERSTVAEVVRRLQGATIALTNKVVLDRAVLEQAPDLRYIGILATGVNVVDLATARARGIVVSNVPAYSTPSVAQMTFALLLELTHHVGHHAEGVRHGAWVRSRDFSYADYPLIELEGLKLGLIGFGAIAQATARIGLAFGMEVSASRHSGRPAEVAGVQLLGLETLLRESDAVSVHCPLTEETRGLINTARLSLMKQTAFLLNTSRGAIVVEQDLAEALNGERIAGAGLDVLSTEPPEAENPLLSAKNCLVTPHIAFATRSARARLLETVRANLATYLQGKPQNVVS